jgi:amino acid transporter
VTVPLPAGATAVVSWYSVAKLAVYVVAAAGAVTVWDRAPPSDHPEKTYRLPADSACGDVVAMVWVLPGVQVNVRAPVKVAPSTV